MLCLPQKSYAKKLQLSLTGWRTRRGQGGDKSEDKKRTSRGQVGEK